MERTSSARVELARVLIGFPLSAFARLVRVVVVGVDRAGRRLGGSRGVAGSATRRRTEQSRTKRPACGRADDDQSENAFLADVHVSLPLPSLSALPARSTNGSSQRAVRKAYEPTKDSLRTPRREIGGP